MNPTMITLAQVLDLHGGPAKWYARGFSECCMHSTPIRAVCQRFAAYALTDLPMRCGICKQVGKARDLIQLIEPTTK